MSKLVHQKNKKVFFFVSINFKYSFQNLSVNIIFRMWNLQQCLCRLSANRAVGNLLVKVTAKSLPCVTTAISTGRSFHLLTTTMPFQLTGSTSIGQPHIDLLKSTTPMVSQSAGFKVKGRLKRRCKDCYFVMRQERMYVICKTHPRHKQMAIKKDEDKTWILTDATQGKKRAWWLNDVSNLY